MNRKTNNDNNRIIRSLTYNDAESLLANIKITPNTNTTNTKKEKWTITSLFVIFL